MGRGRCWSFTVSLSLTLFLFLHPPWHPAFPLLVQPLEATSNLAIPPTLMASETQDPRLASGQPTPTIPLKRFAHSLVRSKTMPRFTHNPSNLTFRQLEDSLLSSLSSKIHGVSRHSGVTNFGICRGQPDHLDFSVSNTTNMVLALGTDISPGVSPISSC